MEGATEEPTIGGGQAAPVHDDCCCCNRVLQLVSEDGGGGGGGSEGLGAFSGPFDMGDTAEREWMKEFAMTERIFT